MGASKELFANLKNNFNEVNFYDSTFSKKDAQKTGIDLVDKILNEGEIGKLEFFANIVRLKEVIDSAVLQCREKIEILEKESVFGVEFVPSNGNNTLNYNEDTVWNELKKELDERTEQLKLAQKQDTFDAYGNQLPKVSKKQSKGYVRISF